MTTKLVGDLERKIIERIGFTVKVRTVNGVNNVMGIEMPKELHELLDGGGWELISQHTTGNIVNGWQDFDLVIERES